MTNSIAGASRTRQLVSALMLFGSGAAIAGCATARPTQVSPNEIPALEQRLAGDPTNADVLLRYSAALFAASRCDSAMVVARNGMSRQPQAALGPLVLGQCLEQQQSYDQALDVYQRYLTGYPEEPGSSAVRARQIIARRDRATGQARLALQRETELAQQATDPQVVAVLPLSIVGDSAYLPLSRGLAQILTSDLALLERFRMVERLQVGALLEEMQLGQTARVDASTAARVGRLLQAGRMVQGLAVIDPDAETRLEASVILSDGEVTAPTVETGEFGRLLDMEKRVVIGVANQLGYFLSEAELRLILENGTQNLAAFLAYSRGLVAEDLGDYSAAALHYRAAVQADPSFQAARDQYQATTVAPVVEAAAATDVVVVAAEPPPEPQVVPALPPIDAISSTVSDIASIQSEQVTPTQTPVSTGTQTTALEPPPTPTVEGTPVTGTVTGRIRIFFRLP
jgi:tetratricopeptide (TPR) repeat protein